MACDIGNIIYTNHENRIRYFSYGEIGHRQANCRKTKWDLLTNEVEFDLTAKPVFDNYDDLVDEEFMEGDVGLLLMLCRTFLSPCSFYNG